MTCNKGKSIPYSIIQELLGDLRRWSKEKKPGDYIEGYKDGVRDMSIAFTEYLWEPDK